NSRKTVVFQACPADKGAVNIGTFHQGIDIIGRYAAAVEYSNSFSRCNSVKCGEFFAYVMMGILCLFRCSGLAGADRPNRLIGNYNAGCGDILQPFADLPFQDIECLPGLTLIKGLADTKDDFQIMLSRNFRFPVKNFICFFEILASFRMADNNMAAPGISKHGWSDLTGICAFLLIEQVLCSKVYGTVCQEFCSSV